MSQIYEIWSQFKKFKVTIQKIYRSQLVYRSQIKNLKITICSSVTNQEIYKSHNLFYGHKISNYRSHITFIGMSHSIY